MSVSDILSIWSEACKGLNITWYLYKETLLCAHVYGYTPDILKSARIAVLGKDIYFIVNNIFPKLPEDWNLEIIEFVTVYSTIRFTYNSETVLEIDVLCDVDSREDAEVLETNIKVTHCKTFKKIKLFEVIGDYIKPLACCFEHKKGKYIEKIFDKIIRIPGHTADKKKYYSDSLTNVRSILLKKEWFSDIKTLSFNGVEYPVFSGYLEYLEAEYHDYVNGISDEIGCGLTVTEKLELKEHQKRCVEALTFISELSEEFNLRYYLIAGSVLGCVRHKGFIPWDDDIDIGIRLEDLNEFEHLVAKYLPERLPEGFSLKVAAANSDYPRMFSKICYNGRCCMDLWPLIPTNTSGFKFHLMYFFAENITRIHYKMIGYKLMRFKRLIKVFKLFFSDKTIMSFARKNERMFIKDITNAYINLYSIYPKEKEVILNKWLNSEATGIFEGLNVPIVGCTDEYLTHLYGNYMSIPAPWKRASRHFERF